jgi:hypothetical protein
MRGSITVEAAMLCPFLCVVVCAMVVVTFFLYDMVGDFGEEAVTGLIDLVEGVKLLRIERMMCGE